MTYSVKNSETQKALEIIPKNTKVKDIILKEIIEKHSFKPQILQKSATIAKKLENHII